MLERGAFVILLPVLFLVTNAHADLAKDLRLEAPIASPGAPLPEPAGKLEISAWTNRESGRIHVGDDLEIVLKANADCYAYVIDLGTAGGAHMIFPNKKTAANQVKTGKIVTIPERGSYRVKVEGPAGAEHLVILASTKPLQVYENLHLIGPRQNAGELELGAGAGKGLRLTPGRASEATPAPSPAPSATSGPDLEPLLAALERAASVDRARDLACAVVSLTVDGESASAQPARRQSPGADLTPATGAPATAVPATGRLTIDVTPAGRIYVDGKYRGLGHATVACVSTGEHEITILQEGHRTHLERIVITGGDERTVKIQLQKGP